MIQVFPTPDDLADAVARHIVACAAEAVAATGRFTVALSGGSTPRDAYARLSYGDLSHQVDWQRTHVLWGDERCVPPDDPRSNYRMAWEVLLERVAIPPEQIHRIRGEDEPERAAATYERDLRGLLDCHPERSEGSSRHRTDHLSNPLATLTADPSLALRMTNSLDLVLLGLGEDGHTASLFPGQSAVHETDRWVLAAPAPAGDIWRVTLTPPILNAARNVTFMISGAGKAQRLQQVIEGPFTPDQLPAQAIRPVQGRLTWMLDQGAAGRLRASRAST